MTCLNPHVRSCLTIATPWVLYKTQFSLLDSTCLMSTSTSLINKNVKTYRTTAFFLPKHGKTIRFFFISSCFLLHSEPSGIQPGGRPHATRWTRPSWRRTEAEPGPCYREPPMERSWHGYGTLNLSVGSLGSSSQPWWRSISCGYALNINNILISDNILKFEIRIYSSHGNI